MKDVIMPKLGLTMTEGVIGEWFRKEGEYVEAGEPLFSVETDKLTNDVQCRESGVLAKILVSEGETAECQDVVAQIDETAEAPVKGAEGSAASEDQEAATAPGASDRQQPAAAEPEGGAATPLAEKIAAELGIDISGSEGGRVYAGDVLAASGKAGVATPHSEHAEPMSRMRKLIAENMLNSVQTSPTVTFNVSMDMTNAKALREQLKAADLKVSYTDIIVKCVASALRKFPELNCSVDGTDIIYKDYINIGVAVALDNGLLVPNIPDTDTLSLMEISSEVKALAEGSRNGSLDPSRLEGGTFTVTNLGMYGIESFSPIINQPEVAILGVNAMADTPVCEGGNVVIKPLMGFSLTADHRVVDGSTAAQFLQELKRLIENPVIAVFEI